MRSRSAAMKVLAPLLLLVCTPALAEPGVQASETLETPTRHVPSDTARSEGVRTSLSPGQQAAARAWSVTEAEYRRYRGLLQGVRGAVSDPRISPLEVLGIHAKNAAERTGYARRFARVMHDDTTRVLAFERAYRQAWRDIYPQEPVIDPQRLRPEDRPRGKDLVGITGFQLLYFLDTACTDCNPLLGSLLRTVQKTPGARLDLYLTDLGSGDEAAARRWAAGQKIDPERVRSGQVTLNLGRGVLARLAPDAEPPQVFFRQDGRILPLDPLSALEGVRP